MLKYSMGTDIRKVNLKNTKRYGHALKIYRYLLSLRQWELLLRISFMGICQKTRKNCLVFLERIIGNVSEEEL